MEGQSDMSARRNPHEAGRAAKESEAKGMKKIQKKEKKKPKKGKVYGDPMVVLE
jgi:hypothetical protein